jgi:hypothetical protein
MITLQERRKVPRANKAKPTTHKSSLVESDMPDAVGGRKFGSIIYYSEKKK